LRAGRRVKISSRSVGETRARRARNAQCRAVYRTRFNENTAAHFDALETLRSVLGLPAVPRRIECFDISTIQGSETVASMVVCEDGG
jgi:excinuclease ABC subunit C